MMIDDDDDDDDDNDDDDVCSARCRVMLPHYTVTSSAALHHT